MIRTLIIGLASVAALTATALTPALADVNYCMDHPNPNTCPYGAGAVDESPLQLNNQGHLFHNRYLQRNHKPAIQNG